MFVKLVAFVSVLTGFGLGIVGIIDHPPTAVASLKHQLIDVRSGAYQRRIDCASDPTCSDLK